MTFGLEATEGGGNEGWIPVLYFSTTIEAKQGGVEGVGGPEKVTLLKMKHEVGECEELILCMSLISHFLTCQHWYPTLAVVLFFTGCNGEAGVTTTDQFSYEQLLCSRDWQFIYFNLNDWEKGALHSSHCVHGTRHRPQINGPGPAALACIC